MFKTFSDARSITHPRIMEAVNAHLKGVKPLLYEVSINVVERTVQPEDPIPGPTLTH